MISSSGPPTIHSDASHVVKGKTTTGNVAETVYQNTSGRLQLHIICLFPNIVADVSFYSDAANPPTTVVAENVQRGAGDAFTLSGLVSPNHYYKLSSAATETIKSWELIEI